MEENDALHGLRTHSKSVAVGQVAFVNHLSKTYVTWCNIEKKKKTCGLKNIKSG